MARKEKKKQKNDRKMKSARGRLLFFAVVAGAITGYLVFQAGRDEPGRSEEAPSAGAVGEPDTGAPARPVAWSPGDPLPAVSLLSLSGEPFELRVSGESRPILLFIFSPTCSICTQNIPIWKDLFDEAKARSAEVIGISVLDTVRTALYVKQHQLPWDVFCAAGRDGVQALRVERVPMTLLVEGSGTVTEAMRGKLSDGQRETVIQFLEQ